MQIRSALTITTAILSVALVGCSSLGSSGVSGSAANPSSQSNASFQQPAGFAPYAGFGFGGSWLNANTSGLTIEQDQSYSPAAQLTLGVSLNGPLAFELRAADLGEATFDNGDAVGYQVADVSLLYRHNMGRWSGFARIGGGALFNDGEGEIEATQKNKSHFLVGAGAEYALSSRWGLRAEWQGHDVDVMHSQLNLIYRFGGQVSRRPVSIVQNNDEAASPQTESAPISQSVTPETKTPNPTVSSPTVSSPTVSTPEVSAPEVSVPTATAPADNAADLLEIETTPDPNLPAAQQRLTVADTQDSFPDVAMQQPVESRTLPSAVLPEVETPLASSNTANQEATGNLKPLVTVPIEKKIEPTSQDLDKDGIEDASDNCVGTAEGMPVFANGCAMFGDSVPGLSFFPDTDRLTSTGTVVLDDVANALNEYSDIRVTVAAHTRSSTDSNAAMFLTRRRTISIIRYLTSKGIDATRLRPEAYGDTQPLAGAVEPSDNDRVVLTVQ